MKTPLLLLVAASALGGCVAYPYDTGYGGGYYGGPAVYPQANIVYTPGYRGGRDRDGDGVSNRYDRDRDGDGVRNRDDRRPGNPRRQ